MSAAKTSLLLRMGKGIGRGLFRAGRTVGRPALWGAANLMESAMGFTAGVAGRQLPDFFPKSIGARMGTAVGRATPSIIGGAAGLGARTTLEAAQQAGAPLVAGARAIARTAFERSADNFPFPYTLKRTAKWGLGLGALGVGGYAGYNRGQQRQRVGYVQPQGQMRELGYDAVGNAIPQPANDLGATGDLTLALHKMR